MRFIHNSRFDPAPAYVDQERDTLDPDKTIFEVITSGTEKMLISGREINSRAYVAKFNF